VPKSVNTGKNERPMPPAIGRRAVPTRKELRAGTTCAGDREDTRNKN